MQKKLLSQSPQVARQPSTREPTAEEAKPRPLLLGMPRLAHVDGWVRVSGTEIPAKPSDRSTPAALQPSPMGRGREWRKAACTWVVGAPPVWGRMDLVEVLFDICDKERRTLTMG
jgi:hypothetical protein